VDELQAVGDRQEAGDQRGAGGKHGAAGPSVAGGQPSTAAADQDKPQKFRSQIAVLIWWVWVLFAVANLIDLAVQGHDHVSAVAAAALILGTGIAYVTALRPRVIADEDGIVVKNPLRDHKIGWLAVAKIDLGELLRVHCEWAPDPLHGPGDSGGPGASGGAGGSGEGSGLRRKVIHAWAVQASRRRQAAAELKTRRAASRSAGASPYGRTGSYRLDHVAHRGEADRFARAINESASAPPSVVHMREVEQTVKTLNERAASARERAETARERNSAPGESPLERAAAVAPVTSWDTRSIAALVLPALLLVIVILV
jgi:hypothetical protein